MQEGDLKNSASNKVAQGASPQWTATLQVRPGPMVSDPALLTPAVERFARSGYGSSAIFCYHNWNHIEEVRQDILALIAECVESGVEVNRVALDHAVLLHDIHFGVRFDLVGFACAEQLSAHVAYNYLREVGASEQHARRVEKIIMATHFLVEPQGVEEVIMRAADLKNISGSFDGFIAKTEQLHREHLALSPAPTTFNRFALQSIRFLALYAWRYLSLRSAGCGPPRVTSWHGAALRNLMELYRRVCASPGGSRVAAQFGLQDGLVNFRQPSDFVVLCDLDPISLAREADQLRNRIGLDAQCVSIVMPGDLTQHPLPEESIDELIISTPQPLERVLAVGKAVLRLGGEVYFPEPAGWGDLNQYATTASFGLFEIATTECANRRYLCLQKR